MLQAVSLALLLLVLVGAAPSPNNTIAKNIAEIPSLQTLNAVITNPSYKPVYDALNNPAAKLTLFAPDDNAFNAAGIDPSKVDFVTQVLYYHVIPAAIKSSDLKALQFPATIMSNQSYVNIGAGKAQVLDVTKNGGSVYVNYGIPGHKSDTAEVVQADIQSSNGYIHIINAVASFPEDVSTTAQEAGLTTLLRALDQVGLTSAVDNTVGLSVFAPTNEAFANANWEKLSNNQLKNILLYHVVPALAAGIPYSTTFTQLEQFPTLEGDDIAVYMEGSGRLLVEGAKSNATVLVANALTRNGVVHVIDTVLLPP
jgi:transforming growth factor-beta-induced protein